MEKSTVANSNDTRKLVGVITPVLLLVIVAISTPFAILLNNAAPPYDPLPPGWNSSVTIYLWAARFSTGFIQERYVLGGGITNLHALLFVAVTFFYLAIQIMVSVNKLQIKYGIAIEIVLFLIWVSVCQLIYGILQEWTLIQIPLLPLVGISILLVVYGHQRTR